MDVNVWSCVCLTHSWCGDGKTNIRHIRSIDEHTGGLFVSGTIKSDVNKVRIDIDLANKLNIQVEPIGVLSAILKNLSKEV
jgi:hypothetical protein